jgi:predicted amidohydrolase YtcJ
LGSAYQLRLDDRVGSIEVGKLADLTIIDGDLLGAPPESIRDLPVWMTVVGGAIAFENAPARASAAGAGDAAPRV